MHKCILAVLVELLYKRYRTFLVVKRLERGAGHLPASSAGLRMGWNYASSSAPCMHKHVVRRPLLYVYKGGDSPRRFSANQALQLPVMWLLNNLFDSADVRFIFVF